MSIDLNTRAASAFWREIQRNSEQAHEWDTDVVFHEIRPDEVYDATLVSQRVYGRRDEFLAVMAAAGVDSVSQALPQKNIILPNKAKLTRLKRKTGFESQAEMRDGFAPTWADTSDES